MGPKKKQKNPLAPKKPLGPYLEFAKTERAAVLADLGSPTTVEVARELGRRWKNLPLAEMESFKLKSRGNTEKYVAEMKKFGGPLPPKKPLSPYLEFSKLERPIVLAEMGSSLSFGDLGKELGRRWKALPQFEKGRFEEVTKENWKKYSENLKELPKENSSNSPVAPPSSSTEQQIPDEQAPPKSPSKSTTIESGKALLAGDLGFAKQRFYPWHPAMKTGVLARGSRILVTYFGTAQTGTIDRSKWVQYSKHAEEKICSPSLLKKGIFKKGLDQLKAMLSKINSGGSEIDVGSGVGFSEQPVGRKLVKLSKDGLMMDEEQNLRLMKDKILEIKGMPYKWACRDCPWKGQFQHKAKQHARDCGTRRRENTRKIKDNKFGCSGEGCSLAFASKCQLQKHYR